MTGVPEADVRDNPTASRYELHLEGRLRGRIDYRLGPETIDLAHAEVEPALRGRGLGEAMVERAVADACARGLGVVGSCSFVAAWLRRHPAGGP